MRNSYFFSLVTKTSRITLKTLDHSVILRKSNLIGESTFNLIDILRQHNGKLSNVELHVDLKNDGAKVGTLVVKLDGLRVDMGSANSTAGIVSSTTNNNPPTTTNPMTNSTGTVEKPISGLSSTSASGSASAAPLNGLVNKNVSLCNGVSNSTQVNSTTEVGPTETPVPTPPPSSNPTGSEEPSNSNTSTSVSWSLKWKASTC